MDMDESKGKKYVGELRKYYQKLAEEARRRTTLLSGRASTSAIVSDDISLPQDPSNDDNSAKDEHQFRSSYERIPGSVTNVHPQREVSGNSASYHEETVNPYAQQLIRPKPAVRLKVPGNASSSISDNLLSLGSDSVVTERPQIKSRSTTPVRNFEEKESSKYDGLKERPHTMMLQNPIGSQTFRLPSRQKPVEEDVTIDLKKPGSSKPTPPKRNHSFYFAKRPTVEVKFSKDDGNLTLRRNEVPHNTIMPEGKSEDVVSPRARKHQIGQEVVLRSKTGISKAKFVPDLTGKNQDFRISVGYVAKGTNDDRIVSMVITKLINSEKSYLEKMQYVIDNYMEYFRRSRLSRRIEAVFGNIEKLHLATEKMYEDLKQCQTVDDVARTFLQHANILELCTEYRRNKSYSHELATKTFLKFIKDRQNQLDDEQPLASYLLEPVERPRWYKRYLETLQETLAKRNQSSELLDEAIALVGEITSKADTLQAIDSILWCPIELAEQGPLLMKDTFNVKRKTQTVVFLFQNCIVFCEEDKVKSDRYNYINCIEMENLILRHRQESKAFQLSCLDKPSCQQFNEQFEFYLEAWNENTKEEWITQIQEILWSQVHYFKIKQSNFLENFNSQLLPQSEYDIVNGQIFREHVVRNGNEEYCPFEYFFSNKESKITGAFYDKHFRLRVEIITDELKTDGIYLEKISKAIGDFMHEEREHLLNLQFCVAQEFCSHFKDISSYDYLLLKKMESIYNETEKLYLRLLLGNTIENVGEAFLENENLFDCYTVYMRNKSAYDYVNDELQKHLSKESPNTQSRQAWNDYMIKLFARPLKYKSFLEELQQLREDSVSVPLQDALDLVNRKISETRTLMNIDCIQRCPIDLSTMGAFVKKGNAMLKNKCRCMLFLFARILVLCIEDTQYRGTYIYFDSIKLAELQVCSAFDDNLGLRCIRSSGSGKYISCNYDIMFTSTSAARKWHEELMRSSNLNE